MTSNEFAEPLVAFWGKLKETVHPVDRAVLTRNMHQHTLNLAYPPPAFVGDIRRARIFVLKANGGYDEAETAHEFASPGSAELYRQRLRNPGACSECNTASYYLRGTLGHWLRGGKAAIVSALAYRSPKISEEPQNVAIVEKLPSVQFHRAWLRSHLLTALDAGRILVIVKRPKLWKLGAPEIARDRLLFPQNHISPHLPKSVIDLARPFL
jgi:hypothetical protein